MAHPHTPRRTNIRPSLAKPGINTASTPHLSAAARTAFDRKASLSALTGSPPTRALDTPANAMVGGNGRPLEVGDDVDVPGGMYGVVKFIGGVRAKKGVFVGVELAREYAARGKNDGDVDGTRYFTTSVPGAGIFLPLHRASKRASLGGSSDSLPPTPVTPAFGASFSLGSRDGPGDGYSSPTPPMPKFSQSMGPGARGTSPQSRTKRPSLARPESPYKNKPSLAPTPARMPTPGRSISMQPGNFSKSAIGPPQFMPSPAPSKVVKPKTPQPRKAPSRANSRLANTLDEDDETMSVGTTSDSIKPGSNHASQEEIFKLQKKLDERDRQLREQAASLADMETSLLEIQNMLPTDGSEMSRSSRSGDYEDGDSAHLRAILREKNEKISLLTAEFDMHRADFRSTIDTLEMASSETVRVYEQRIDDLVAEVRELQERSEDVDSVAEQLKQLEELVQELEEGLEDARRGEAEARGEVEFLRGEVERGRSELRREREKAAAALKGAQAIDSGSSSREVEQRDDEIRGLKAIIHSLSSGGNLASPSIELSQSPLAHGNDDAALAELRASLERTEREKEELRGLVERKGFREEELERELERLRATGEPARDSVISNAQSERTARDSKSTVVSWRGYQATKQAREHERHDSQGKLAPMAESEDGGRSSSAGASELWCEICETGGHDILNCTNDLGGGAAARQRSNEHHNELHLLRDDVSSSTAGADDMLDADMGTLSVSSAASRNEPAPLSVSPSPQKDSAGPAPAATLPNPYETGLVAGTGQEIDADKWCALCERDGHDATACPFDDLL